MDKTVIDLDNNLIIRSENIEHEDDTLKNYLDSRIIDSGSNNNGNWIKYSDGTMICTKKVVFSGLQFTTSFGSMYEAPSVYLGDYAKEFIDTPTPFYSASTSTCIVESFANTKASFGTVTLLRPVKTTADYTYTINLMAIGRWK